MVHIFPVAGGGEGPHNDCWLPLVQGAGGQGAAHEAGFLQGAGGFTD